MEEENDLNSLTEYIFTKNFDNSKIQIDVDGIENIHDMFCFCFDLLCKGLILLYSEDGDQIDVEKLTMDQFNIAKERLSFTGIQVFVETENYKESKNKYPLGKMVASKSIAQTENLSDYFATLYTTNVIIIIRFDL